MQRTGSWQTQDLGHEFPNKPYLFLTIQTYNDTQAVNIRARNISPTGFEAALFEQKSLMDDHSLENIGYLAIHSPNGSGVVELGGNTAVAAHENLTPNAVDILVREETSADPEMEHYIENISVFVAE